MGFIAKRMDSVEASGIRKVFDLAAKLPNPVNLSIGQPHFDVPDEFKEICKQAIDQGRNRYTVTQGIPELQNAVRSYYRRRYNAELGDLLVTSGVSGGILLTFMCLLDPGDELLVFDPYFVMYKQLAQLLGAVVRTVNTYPDFKVTKEKLEKVDTRKVKVVMVNSPTNPTGAVLSEPEMRMIADWAQAHNVIVISDEIYDQFTYDTKPLTMASYIKEPIILNGMSKYAAMTGWRVGFASGPKQLIEKMTTLQQYTFVCSPSMAQYASIKALESDLDPKLFLEYKHKRDMVWDGLKDSYELVKPGGAIYAFPKAPKKYKNGAEFAEIAIKNNVLIIPGNAFSDQDTHFRISYATTNEKLAEGIEILKKLV